MSRAKYYGIAALCLMPIIYSGCANKQELLKKYSEIVQESQNVKISLDTSLADFVFDNKDYKNIEQLIKVTKNKIEAYTMLGGKDSLNIEHDLNLLRNSLINYKRGGVVKTGNKIMSEHLEKKGYKNIKVKGGKDSSQILDFFVGISIYAGFFGFYKYVLK